MHLSESAQRGASWFPASFKWVDTGGELTVLDLCGTGLSKVSGTRAQWTRLALSGALCSRLTAVTSQVPGVPHSPAPAHHPTP